MNRNIDRRLLVVASLGLIGQVVHAQSLSYNFNDGTNTGWQTFASGWQVVNGVYQGTNTGANIRTESVWAAGYGWTDYTVTASMSLQGNHRPSDGELMFRYQDGTHYGMCRLMQDFNGTRFELYDIQRGLLAQTPFPAQIGQWYEIRATIQGTTATCEIAGVPSSALTATYTTTTTGTVGLRNTHIPAWFDDIVVTPYDNVSRRGKPEPCIVFVHGSRDGDASYGYGFQWAQDWLVARNYWRSFSRVSWPGRLFPVRVDDVVLQDEQEDFIWAATGEYRRPYFVVRYNGAAPYWGVEAAGLVASQILRATTGEPDYGGVNRCRSATGERSTEYWVVTHSMGATVLDYILGNARTTDPLFNTVCSVRDDGNPGTCTPSTARFDSVASLIAGTISVGGAHRGSILADLVCGISPPVGDVCTHARMWLQSGDLYQVKNITGDPEKPVWLIGGTGWLPTSVAIPGSSDGIVQFASQFACDGSAVQSYDLTICANQMKSNMYILGATTENHDNERNNRTFDLEGRYRYQILQLPRGTYLVSTKDRDSAGAMIDRFLNVGRQ